MDVPEESWVVKLEKVIESLQTRLLALEVKLRKLEEDLRYISNYTSFPVGGGDAR